MVSPPNRVETSNLLALPLGNDADYLGRDLFWLTQTIASCKSSLGTEDRPKMRTFRRVCHPSFPQSKEKQFAGCDILRRLLPTYLPQ